MGLYDTTIGTLLVGIFFNTFLYGFVTYQFAAYYQTKFNDSPALKYMVLFLFVLDTFHSASAIYLAWYYVVTNYNNPAALAVAPWPHTFTPVATALTALITQTYLGFRIRRLTGSKILFGVVILLAIPSFILGMTLSIKAWTIRVISEFTRTTPIAIGWLSTQVVVDTFITITLVMLFSRSRTGFRKTDTILNRFIRGAIQTGLFAGVFAVGNLITFIVLPDMNFYVMFAIPMGRIYTNTLLDILLARGLLQTVTDDAGDMSVVIDSVCWPHADSHVISMIPPTSIELKVQEITHETCGRSCSERAEAKVGSTEF